MQCVKCFYYNRYMYLVFVYDSGGGINCVICCMRVPPLVCDFLPLCIPLLQSDWSLSCDHGLHDAS